MKKETIPVIQLSTPSRGPCRQCILGLLITALGCFLVALPPKAFGLNPAPDGAYPNGNTAEGGGALSRLDVNQGSLNTAVGYGALENNVSNDHNTAIGAVALQLNTADENTAVGAFALQYNTSGIGNCAVGFQALSANTSGGLNTATGSAALHNNTSGVYNTADGGDALSHNTIGNYNIASGSAALEFNVGGSNNTAIGLGALNANTSGNNNIAIGSNAGVSLTTGSNNIDIGAAGKAGESNKIRIGKQGLQNGTFIAGISGVTVSGSTVVVNTMGKLGVASSSARYKEAVKAMDHASEAILKLKLVTFRYKEEIDPEKTPQFGLIAEDVEKIDPTLVTRDESGKLVTVRYEAVNAMLLNEFLKEHRKTETLDATVAQQQKQIEALTAGLQKMGATLAAQTAELRTAGR